MFDLFIPRLSVCDIDWAVSGFVWWVLMLMEVSRIDSPEPRHKAGQRHT
jgi:hypothetical protein